MCQGMLDSLKAVDAIPAARCDNYWRVGARVEEGEECALLKLEGMPKDEFGVTVKRYDNRLDAGMPLGKLG